MPTKKIVVNRKFLMKLADSIYNPKTRAFLRLCDGQLQNGPDPEDETRPMHCGLGELYYAMTGWQPKTKHVTEDQVVDLAVELSPISSLREAAIKEKRSKFRKAVVVVNKLDLPDDVKDTLICGLNDHEDYLDDEERCETETKFREILSEIPNVNDANGGRVGSCGDAAYRERSQRVAKQLRSAAKLLP